MSARFTQALQYLLPQGWAWPREPGSVWMRVLMAWAQMLDEHDRFVSQAATDWLPQSTRTRLADWEAATGLPDGCMGPGQSFAIRQAQVLARLRGATSVYADGCPAAPGTLEDLCAAAGVPAEVAYHTPFRVGRNRIGERIGARDGKLMVRIAAGAAQPFRVGQDRVGSRLVRYAPEVAMVRCLLERVVPARFYINVIAA